MRRTCDDEWLPNQFQGLRILVVRLGAMGDILHALPAVTALRAQYPDSWIGWVVEPQWEPLLRAASATDAVRGPQMPVVDVLHSVPIKRWARRPLAPATLRQIKAVRHALRSQHYDVCVDLQGAIRSAWIGSMAATRLVGESRPREALARWLFHDRIATSGVHVIEQAREVVAGALKCDAEDFPDCAAALPVDPDAQHWCDALLSRFDPAQGADGGLERGRQRFVLLNPGAGWGAKRWPVERYAAVAADLVQMGYAIAVNAGPGEAQLAETIRAEAGACVFVLNGSVGQLIACTRRASLMIGGDTGPLHLAAALKVPVVGIYGPTDPARNGPYGTRARVLRNPASRRDHSRRNDPEAGLLTITVEDVLEAARQLLEESTPEPGSPGVPGSV